MGENVYLNLKTVKYVDWTSIEHSSEVGPDYYVQVTLHNGLTIFISDWILDQIAFEYKQMKKDMEKHF